MANAFDSTNAPEGEPSEVVVGDFLQWKRSDLVSDYPTDLYSLSYVARINNSASEITISTTGQTTHFLATALNAATSTYAVGDYSWQAEITRTSDGERVTVDRGSFAVIADLDAENADTRSHAQIMVDKIESLLSGKADSDVASYSIAGRSLTKMSFQDLVNARDYYRAEATKDAANLDAKYGRKGASTIRVRF
jgi:hypothetical protein